MTTINNIKIIKKINFQMIKIIKTKFLNKIITIDNIKITECNKLFKQQI